MGIFSDSDISEVETVINREWDKRRRLEFLKGFEEGRIYGKKIDETDTRGIFIGLPYDTDARIHKIHIAIDSPPSNFYYFGTAFGYLIGILKYHPKLVLHPYNSDKFIGYAKDIREYKSIFFPFLQKRLLRWNENIKKYIGELSPEEIRNYKKIVKVV